ncbi:tetratricopeptide repeat protein [Flavihumibacter sp. R14]|nr:tetratricopeptide repeat protein [Flavihumibacter soli]
MKKLIPFLIYIPLSLIFLGLLLLILNFPGGLFLFLLGLLGTTLYYSARTTMNFIKTTNTTFNISLQILIILMSVILFAKYFYHGFANYPALIIVPTFIVLALANFKLNKFKDRSISVTCFIYLLAIMPLFAFEFHNSPIQFIPRQWYNRYNVEKRGGVDMSYPFNSKEVEELSAKGFKLSESKNYYAALATYRKAISMNPENPRHYFDISTCYASINDLESGVKALDTAIFLDAKNPAFYNNRGLIFYKLRNTDKAIKDYKTAIKLDSTESTYFINIALAYHYADSLDQACEALLNAEDLGVKLADYDELRAIRCK